MPVQFDYEKCTGCTTCADECPTDAIAMKDEKPVLNEGECVDCGTCRDNCPEGAISDK
ncbi:MAG: 4Fe-4S binding protein [Phycisphaeraceae bacterium]|nr:4Fe-4S binding protein [Phycisphaeraceae bacterium]